MKKSKVKIDGDDGDEVDNRDKVDGRNNFSDNKVGDNKIAKKRNY